MPPTILLLVRHTDVHNPRNLIYGRLPRFRLSEQGRAEALRTARALRDEPIDAAYTSPQLRARQTARLLLQDRPELPLRITSLLAEIYSSWQGVDPAQHGGWVSFYEPPRDAETDESIEMIWRRMERFARRVRRRHAGQTVLAISHGDPIRIFRLGFEGGPFTVAALTRLPMAAKGSITRVEFAADGAPTFQYVDPALRVPAAV
jgi:probable phosphoglycerate mutase